MSASVLFVGSHPIGFPNATGQTLASLYRDISDDDLVQYCYRLNGTNDRGFPLAIESAVAPLDAALRSPIHMLRKFRGEGTRPALQANGLNDAIRRTDLGRTERQWRDIRALADLSWVRVPNRTLHEIKKRGPRVIHSLLGNGRMIRLTIELSRRLNLPVVPHFMDDWITSLYSSGELSGRARVRVNGLFEQVLRRSPALLAIGEAMAEEYSRRYSRPCFVAGNGVDLASFETKPQEGNSPKRLVYVGGLHLGRAEVLLSIARAVDKAGIDWKVAVHTTDADERRVRGLEGSELIEWAGELPISGVPAALRTADALLLAESLTPEIANYTRLSVSTKVPQYLAARRAIVAVGPENQASLRAMVEYGGEVFIAHGLDDKALAPLSRFLLTVGRETSREFPTKFLEKNMSETFLSTLEQAAQVPLEQWRSGR